ncbi:MAG: V-type ATP synthase subunit C [Methanomicrobiales archaeon]|nr:V-type ATP synthase subunit C [Methanomicrobiales archaeon]
MAMKLWGPGPYIYVCTRMRVRKSKLLPREEYVRLLQMSLPEIARFIGETEYKREIDELSASFGGIDLIETALSWNLAKEYQAILTITPGTLRDFTEAYLRRWDIQNVLTVLRGKSQGMGPGKIKELLIPAGELDRATLDRLLNEDGPERVVEALKGRALYPIVAAEFSDAQQTGSYSRMANELYKQFYADLLIMARSGLKGGSLFLAFIVLDIDITNIRNLFRFRADEFAEDTRSMMIQGGTFGVEELQHLNTLVDRTEFIRALTAKITNKTLIRVLDSLREAASIREVEIDLIRVQLGEMEKMSKLHPISIHPILVYLEKKKYEIFNIRAIARGKESHLAPDRIRRYLVM